MERYYKDSNRMRAYEIAVERGHYVTTEQLRDILGLLKDGKWPDGTFSDDECNVWSLIREELGIEC